MVQLSFGWICPNLETNWINVFIFPSPSYKGISLPTIPSPGYFPSRLPIQDLVSHLHIRDLPRTAHNLNLRTLHHTPQNTRRLLQQTFSPSHIPPDEPVPVTLKKAPLYFSPFPPFFFLPSCFNFSLSIAPASLSVSYTSHELHDWIRFGSVNLNFVRSSHI